MQNKYSFLIIALLSLSFIETKAQEKINKDVKVVREYTPTVSDAYKVNYMPEVDDSITTRPTFNYRILSTSIITDYQPSLITPAKIQTSREQRLLKSYVKGGVGNYGTILGEIGYNILESEPFLLGLNIGHTTSLSELKLEDDTRVKAPFHDTWANAAFKHFFDDKTLSVDLGFLHNMYKYYGMQTLDNELPYFLPGSSVPTNGSQLQHDDSQRLSGFDISVGLNNNTVDDRKTAYNADFAFSSFGNLSGVNQNGIKLSGNIKHPVNNLIFGLDAKVETYKNNVPDSIGPMFSFNERSLTLIQATPSVNFTFDNASLKVGVLIGGQIDTEGDRFFVAPDIFGQLTVVEGIVSIYGGMDGNLSMNDYRSVIYDNPFISPDINVKSSLYGLNLFAGIEGNFSSSTSFSSGLEYSFFNDEHFFVNKYYSTQPETSSVPAVLHYTNLFEPVYDDGTLLKVKGELLFRPKQELELLLHGTYFGWNLDSEVAAWHKPEVEIGLKGDWDFNEHLTIKGGISYLGKRKAFDLEADNFQKTLDGVVDFNLGGDYRFSKQWSFWANLNNIAASKYYKWNGYPSQRFNVQAGIVYSF